VPNAGVADKGKDVTVLSGRTFRPIEAAVKEMERRGGKIEPFEIQVEVLFDSVIVAFGMDQIQTTTSLTAVPEITCRRTPSNRFKVSG
jgi:hypothetical protein